MLPLFMDRAQYFEESDNEPGCTWQMPIQEARDLARWWRMENPGAKNGQSPLNNFSAGSILVSMFARTLIHVCGFDIHRRVGPVGYSLPRDVVEYLTAWLPEHEPE